MRQFCGSFLAFTGAAGRALGGLRHARDVFGDIRAALGGFGHIAADLIGRRALFFHRAGDRGLELVNLLDDAADLTDGQNRGFGQGDG